MTPEKYYLIKRNGDLVGVPESLMTEEDFLNYKADELKRERKRNLARAKICSAHFLKYLKEL